MLVIACPVCHSTNIKHSIIPTLAIEGDNLSISASEQCYDCSGCNRQFPHAEACVVSLGDKK